MSNNKSGPLSVELITTNMNKLAREIRLMETRDPRRDRLLKSLFKLRQLRLSLKSARKQLIRERQDELVREMTRLKTDDPRWTQIVQSITRLKDLLDET